MAILIGGSPSTGSSMLRRVLDRHSQIFCGSETSIFAKEALYTDWTGSKSKLLSKSYFGLLNAGWHHYRSIDIEPEYVITTSEIKKIIKQSDTFHSFSTSFYKNALEKSGKTLWAEKTPSNAFTLKLFLDHFPDSKVIHITRHPLDCIASLVNRGMDVYNAICVYMLNTIKALDVYEHKNAYLIKYEELTSDPENTLQDLMQFLGLTYESKMLLPDKKPTGVTSMTGWQYEETGAIKTKSVGRFKKLNDEIQQQILDGLLNIKCKVDGEQKSISDIINVLHYNLSNVSSDSSSTDFFTWVMRKDKWHRQLRRAYFRGSNYPIQF